MSLPLPMFPLNTVLFPGVVVPLRVFEDRYRSLVHHLLREPDPTRRLFGSVAIREGYEVGEHGTQSLFRVGCRLQLTEVSPRADGSFDIEAVGRDRIRLDRLDTGGPFPQGEVAVLPTERRTVPRPVVEQALAVFHAYRAAVTGLRADPLPETLPRDPELLSWTLAAVAPLPLPERQSLLETEDAELRLVLVTDLLRGELRTMNVLPSLPATEVARTRWSPN
ncbi:MAG TPA: LON peptidase substrate-binding domain-containing protein [Nocardioides sp.]|uniref:LON peptidase substrate-binding domain-containing protein n=1 Tax=Nocardioides sp. TaxID=35761 RepID=UPI002C70F882|nr:LON peptidase substrate-binding domain-containing protein [Nocardioides sp.]HQR25922.1 LON peptidase substrate-binding domain-containing protein [Nocardioides sp.]